MPEGAAQPTTESPSLAALLLAFMGISLSGFGGVLPWARRMIVERRRWMTVEEFNETYALCNFLPGPNIVNFSVVFGARFRGVAGAVAALAGLLGPPVAIVLALGALYAEFQDVAAVRRVLGGIAPAAAGLMLATAAKMAEPMLRRRAWPAIAVALAAILAVAGMRWPLPWVLLVLVPISIAWSWRRR